MTARAKRGVVGAIGLCLAASVVAITVIGPVGAQGEEEEVRLPFGPVGIARGQTAVLNVVLVALPPSPCRATLTFYDAAGQVLRTREEPATAMVTLEEPNVTASFELPAVQAPGEEQVRTEILPAVQAPPNPCADLVATLEIVDGSGRTSVLVHPGVLRGLNPQPEPPS
jgi:hypothetical protein